MSTVRTHVSHAAPVLLMIALLTSASTVHADSPAVARLDWLAGHWAGTTDGVFSEEHWSSPAGGGMVGMHKDVRDGRMSAFEFLRIVSRGDSTCYVASPNGAPPTTFCLEELGERRVVFANPAHDFPQRILYWIGDDDRLHARIEGDVRGERRSMEWIWTRQGQDAK